ncbi:alpha/beta fold hydrolase [Hyphomicrobium sp. LHD-15]|uniref:PHA/PHB synthase family protein n=1 Tax=Hyphomicrobium sp. LHD-15 TaxID=3072142 RepID=UPI00280E12C0|nr:alpha/beta fold hydrolase [Hyphomicrobium sp. LHD-15]MDQ8700186.1 alpha/beta fold hydrolase [Hyphomicrobium sp. LHD-15]
MTNSGSALRKTAPASASAGEAQASWAAPSGRESRPDMSAEVKAASSPFQSLFSQSPLWPAHPMLGEPALFSPQCGRSLDRSLNFLVSRLTFGLAPSALAEVYFDWLIHLAASPGKQAELAQEALLKSAHLMRQTFLSALPHEASAENKPKAADKRFGAPEWNTWPFSFFRDAFLLQESWWDSATKNIHGMTRQHTRVANFVARQLLDMTAPSNFIATNPVVLGETVTKMGTNLVEGLSNLAEDLDRSWTGQPPVGTERFKVGENVAATPGKVVYRNDLIELIQYEPTTEKVHAEPVLIVPAWIMKYYILDLSQENSLVKYLRDEGFTVFMVSWKNPTAEERDLGMDAYRKLGILSALDVVEHIVPGTQVHAVGYCLGGTLLSITAAALAGEIADGRKERFKSLSLFAAQMDFIDAGELTLFINESQVSFLEDVMYEQGVLSAFQMAGTFQLLRSNDLIWSRVVRDYMMGKRMPSSDLMAWNADATRMPARMHGEYLRRLYLDNELTGGHYHVDGKPIALTDIRAPLFVVGTETDHVAPWRSVYKINLFTDTEITFALTTGGHNAGVVSPPANSKRQFRIATRAATDTYIDPDRWLAETPRQSGSWWPAWTDWLRKKSSGRMTAPPHLGGAGAREDLPPAPGTYVFQR